MTLLRFTNCARNRVVFVCTQSRLVMFQGRVFLVNREDVADMCSLEQLTPAEIPKTHVVALINGEWEHWTAHVHFFLMLEEENSKHFLLRLRWHLHSSIRKYVMKIQRWWRFMFLCRAFSLPLRRKASFVAVCSQGEVSPLFVAGAQSQPRQRLPPRIRLHSERQ